MSGRTVDVVVVGAGLAGLAAAAHAAADGLSVVLAERALPGGEAINALPVERVPGSAPEWDLPSVAAALCTEVAGAGVEFATLDVTGLRREADGTLAVLGGDDLGARAVVVATGGEAALLAVEGAEAFAGRGVSTCVACDAPLSAGLPAVVAGGGAEALHGALHLVSMCPQVTVVHEGAAPDAPAALVALVRADERIEVLADSVVTALWGATRLEGVGVRSAAGTESKLAAGALFVQLGSVPASGPFRGFADVDPAGHLIVDAGLETSQPGVFAAGVVRSPTAATNAGIALGDGVFAATVIERRLRQASRGALST